MLFRSPISTGSPVHAVHKPPAESPPAPPIKPNESLPEPLRLTQAGTTPAVVTTPAVQEQKHPETSDPVSTTTTEPH